ncbi:MAG: hypothetical protein ABJ275_01765 [Maricaulaceae bacterium]
MIQLSNMVLRGFIALLLGINLFVCAASAASTDVTAPEDVSLELEKARALFDAGDYAAARMAAEDIGTADAYILASETVTATIILGHFKKPNAAAKEALSLAEKALALNPDDVDARLQHALTYGLVAQSTGDLKAWRKKLPVHMRDLIEGLRRDAPDDARGHALLGAWNLEIVNKVGDRNAYKWYKANADEGIASYEMALKLANDDIIIKSNYGAAMILLDDMESAKKLLSAVMDVPPTNAAEIGFQKRVAILNASLEGSNSKALKKAAKAFLNNKPL